jgi:hypothetical protein
MKIEKAFGNNFKRVNCPTSEFYKNQELTNSLDRVFSLPEVKKFDFSRDSQEGTGLTFSDHPYLSLANLPGAHDLVSWVSTQLGNVKFVRSWANRIFQGCQGRIHNHLGYGKVDIVGIFYADVPTTGAELIIVNGGETGKTHLDYNEQALYRIQPQQGELIIHDPSIFHTVGKHTENMTRTVFVFDAIYTD